MRRAGLFSAKKFVDGFSSVLYMQLFINVVNMLADGTCGNMKMIGDFFVQQSFRKKMEYFIFTG